MFPFYRALWKHKLAVSYSGFDPVYSTHSSLPIIRDLVKCPKCEILMQKSVGWANVIIKRSVVVLIFFYFVYFQLQPHDLRLWPVVLLRLRIRFGTPQSLHTEKVYGEFLLRSFFLSVPKVTSMQLFYMHFHNQNFKRSEGASQMQCMLSTRRSQN